MILTVLTGEAFGMSILSSAFNGGYCVSKADTGWVAVRWRISSATAPTPAFGKQYTLSAARSQVSKAAAFHVDLIPILQAQHKY
jgi:hypothetical protein